MGGGFPQYSQWQFQHRPGLDRHAEPRGQRDPQRRPRLPELARPSSPDRRSSTGCPTWRIGSYTGQYQAGWNVAGNNQLRRLRRGVPLGERRRPAGSGPLRRPADRAGQARARASSATPIVPTARARLGHRRPGQLAGRLRPGQPQPHLPGHPRRALALPSTRRPPPRNWWTLPHAGVRRLRATRTGRTPTRSSSATPTATRSSAAARRSRCRPRAPATNAYADVGAHQRGAHLLADERVVGDDGQRPCRVAVERAERRRHRRPGRHRRDLEPAGRDPRRRQRRRADRQRLEPGLRGQLRRHRTAASGAPRPPPTPSPASCGSGPRGPHRPASAAGGCSASATSRTATPATATGTSTWTARDGSSSG